MTSILIFGGVVGLLVALVLVARWWGKSQQQRDDLNEVVGSVKDKKKIDEKVNSMDDADLLDDWLDSVRKRR